MIPNKAYDKAKWHDETVESYGLPESARFSPHRLFLPVAH